MVDGAAELTSTTPTSTARAASTSSTTWAHASGTITFNNFTIDNTTGAPARLHLQRRRTNITVDGTNAFGFRAQSLGTVNIVDVGTTQIISNNGTALLINPTNLNATLDSITSGGGATGISLTGMGGSGLTVGSRSASTADRRRR